MIQNIYNIKLHKKGNFSETFFSLLTINRNWIIHRSCELITFMKIKLNASVKFEK